MTPLGRVFSFLVAVSLLAACNGAGTTLSSVPSSSQAASGTSSSPIQHVVIVVQENRTFNNFFATFPGADGTTTR